MEETQDLTNTEIEKLRLDFKAVLALADDDERVERLIELAPQLPFDLLSESLAVISSMDDDLRNLYLTETAITLSNDPSLLDSALNIAYSMAYTKVRSRTLGELANFAEEKQLQNVISNIKSDTSAEQRLAGWIPLADQLSTELKEEAFDTAINTIDEELKVDAFTGFADLFTEVWKQRAFNSTKNMSDPRYQLSAMLALADNTTEIGRDVLNELWKKVESSPDPQIRADFLPQIVSYTPATEHKRLIEQAEIAAGELFDPQNRATTLLNMIHFLPEENERLLSLALDSIQEITEEQRVNSLYELEYFAPLPTHISNRVGEMIQSLDSPEMRREAASRMPQYFNVELEQSTKSVKETPVPEIEAEQQFESSVIEQKVMDQQFNETAAIDTETKVTQEVDIPASVQSGTLMKLGGLGDSVNKVLNFALTSMPDGEQITIPNIFSGLLAHAMNESEGTFAHGLYLNIIDKHNDILEDKALDIVEIMNTAGLSMPGTQTVSADDSGGWDVSSEVTELLKQSRYLINILSDNGPLEDRHLWAAFITGRGDNGWLLKLIEKNNLNRKALIDCTLKAVNENVPGDNDSDWKSFLTPNQLSSKPSSRLSKIISDEPTGKDLLNLEREINAFAKTIAAVDLQPPLAIGLFGDWGAGKSFFMDKVFNQIGEISGNVKTVEDPSFCKHIAQIRFNAWNFVDSNLWASLITRVFDGLAEHMSRGTENIVDRKKGEIIAKLKRLQQLENEATRDFDLQKKKVEQAETQQQELSKKYKESLQQLNSTRSESPFSRLYEEPLKNLIGERGKQAVKKIKPDLNLQDGKDLDDLVQQLQQGFSLLEKAGIVDAQGNVNWERLGWIVLASASLAAGGYVLDPMVIDLNKFITAAISGLLPVSAWVTTVTKVFNKNASVITKLWTSDKATLQKQQVEAEYEIALEQANKETSSLRKKLDEIKLEYEDSSNRLKEMDTLTEQMDPNRMFEQFIEESAAREEYRSRLGLISQISHDLEDLTDIFTESNRWKGQDPDENLQEKEQCNEAKGETEGKLVILEKLRRKPIDQIQRIVLYIDDLDRCPPKRVAEVLQAVHLLLAFRLFVVVVAVDPRWLHRALEAYYPVFLESTTHRPSHFGEEHKPRATTPRAYLEKIFQIPYVIPRMDETGFKLLVRTTAGDKSDLNNNDVKDSESNSNDQKVEQDKRAQKANKGKSKSTLNRSKAGKVVGKSTQTKLKDSGNPQILNQDHSDDSPANTANTKIEIQSLENREIDFMEKLHPLISTPRATKRLVNIYKLIRVTVPDDDLKDFIDNRNTAAFRPVLLLLGIVIGFPEQAIELFSKIRQADSSQTFWDFIESIKPDSLSENTGEDQANLSEAQYWLHIYLSLNNVKGEVQHSFNPTISRIKRHISRVERFSFEAAVSTLYEA